MKTVRVLACISVACTCAFCSHSADEPISNSDMIKLGYNVQNNNVDFSDQKIEGVYNNIANTYAKQNDSEWVKQMLGICKKVMVDFEHDQFDAECYNAEYLECVGYNAYSRWLDMDPALNSYEWGCVYGEARANECKCIFNSTRDEIGKQDSINALCCVVDSVIHEVLEHQKLNHSAWDVAWEAYKVLRLFVGCNNALGNKMKEIMEQIGTCALQSGNLMYSTLGVIKTNVLMRTNDTYSIKKSSINENDRFLMFSVGVFNRLIDMVRELIGM